MAELANAIAEIFASLLRTVGYVGRPRKRQAIRDDLVLLRELREFPDGEFGPGTAPHVWLVSHIYQQVGEFVGLDFSTEKRKASRSSIVFGVAVSAGFGWLSYYLISHDYGWWWVTPVVIFGSLMAIATWGMIIGKEPVAQEGNLSELDDDAPPYTPALDEIPDLAES